MRVAHISTRLSNYGGEICLANLARGFVERGHQVSCIVRPPSELATQFVGSNVDVVPQEMIDWFDVGTIRRVRRWLCDHPVDILASHTPRDHFIASVASHGLDVCNVATRHQLKPLSFPVFKRPFLRKFGAVIAVSEAVAVGVHQASWLPKSRVVTVLNGVADPVPVGPQAGVRASLGLAAGTPLVGLIGKRCPEKGADVILRAAARDGLRQLPFHLVLIGDGDERYTEHLQALSAKLGLQDRVHFLPYISQVANVMHELDVLVVASHAEPFGLVTVEALAASVPVVATDQGGSPEIISDGREGFLVPPQAESDLANRLECLLMSPGLRREMGARGRNRYLAQFSLERMVLETESVYQNALRTFRESIARTSKDATA
ncbi:MAG: glycosyltransferase involved in cell wall biosynthesis [Candidatus Krumholzibacteriia bacterium]